MSSSLTRWNQTFHEALVKALHPKPTLYVKRHRMTWWSPMEDTVSQAMVVEAHGLPRIALAYYGAPTPVTLWSHLGLNRATTEVRTLGVEITVMEEELLAFAAWLPGFTVARLLKAAKAPEPPHPLSMWGGGLETTRYAWSRAAKPSRFHPPTSRSTP